ncbi:arylsulfatase [Synechococcus sp. 1G10]|uniref:arylsulfatase n=1 Tax=Synechococcus sp. 1G10 TaxID=2025605 RepID=UPI000B996531|nr:arylsulfatase [Synechococcus sp. 1G10]
MTNENDRVILPKPEQPFQGTIGRTAKASTPDFPKGVEAPKGAPNVLIILTDDVGFGATSPFGGPIELPNFERLAATGLRYNTFHTTALCSPTRAAMITGRNHHSVASGVITEMATGYPGYNSILPKSAGTIGSVLKANGYNTAWFGKAHHTPDWMTSQAGPFDLWPVGLGFEYFYGFLGGDSCQWHPNLYENITPIQPATGKSDYILDADLADHAIKFIRDRNAVAPDKPWLINYQTGTAHAPHHAPKEWIAKQKGKYDQGWDKIREETLARQIRMGIVPPGTKLTPRPDVISAWDSLDPDRKRLFSRMMEVYAAALAFCDHQVGRILDELEQSGQLDNTLIFYLMGDNGASAEGTTPQGTTNEVGAAQGVPEDLPFLLSMIDELGGPKVYNHYPVGWAHAMDSPLQWMKQVASHFGGTRNGLVVSWPDRIKQLGEIRSQFHHVIDIAPTIYEAAGITPPDVLDGVEQKPIDGVSMIYSLDDGAAATRRPVQYFELLGNRGLYKDGWMASTTPLRLPWLTRAEVDPDDFQWELYHVAEDFSQANNLAAQHPEKLKELQAAFDVEAKKFNVYPLDSGFVPRFYPGIKPTLQGGRTEYTYYAGTVRIPEPAAPDFKNKSFTIAAEIVIPSGGASGVLATVGGRYGGWSLWLDDSRPRFVSAYSNQPAHKYKTASEKRIPPGHHVVRVRFKYDGGGIGKGGVATLFVDDQQIAEGRVEHTTIARYSLDETFDIGMDLGTPTSEDYVDKMPYAFTGTLHRFMVVLEPEKLSPEDQQRLQEMLANAIMGAN